MSNAAKNFNILVTLGILVSLGISKWLFWSEKLFSRDLDKFLNFSKTILAVYIL